MLLVINSVMRYPLQLIALHWHGDLSFQEVPMIKATGFIIQGHVVIFSLLGMGACVLLPFLM